MQPIQRNKPVFFGNNGKLLVNGKVFIGQPDKDPETYPKTVMFQDNSGNQFQAGQPLRTNENGQLSYNGSAIIALVDGDYSMLIKTSDNVQIDDGYTARVSQVSGGTTETGNYIQYANTLNEVKQLEVQQGDVVENIGKVTLTDQLGARWFVQLPNGQTEDDERFIDFANGLQGGRIATPADTNLSAQLFGAALGTFKVIGSAAGGTGPVSTENRSIDATVSTTRVAVGEFSVAVFKSSTSAYKWIGALVSSNAASASTKVRVDAYNFDTTTVTNGLSFRVRLTNGDTGAAINEDFMVMAIGDKA